MTFEQVSFRGTFRSYQQRVLDRSEDYLRDGRLHIVAAPGSGKTVLGLELIRRLGHPCIILSPTTAIRAQWGQRFRELFLEDPSQSDALFSSDLHKPRLLNSITYQALCSAVEKTPPADAEETEDLSDVDLLRAMAQHGIKTVCLDEAHHLKNEWQKALESFLSRLDPDVVVISLTATPPYDSEEGEWARYMAVCGEIDEEIFVPELVAQNSLCPHQDYIYFNHPTAQECSVFTQHRQNAATVLEQAGSLPFIGALFRQLNRQQDMDVLFANVKEYIALFSLFRRWGFAPGKKVIRVLTAGSRLPVCTLSRAETALQFLLDGPLLHSEEKKQLSRLLQEYGVLEKRRVCLALTEKLRRALISSAGKLESIRRITQSEFDAQGHPLRMLILTDYIKKETLSSAIGENSFSSLSVVSIFETLRRAALPLSLAVLSGSLVILPETSDLSGHPHKKQPIPGTGYCTVEFIGSVRTSVQVVGELFRQGKIQVLIGTKSLLGEGWDAPCINTLILASVVGSFVQSNQMRGRAIRVNRDAPEKTANIWHLVTVEPPQFVKESLSERVEEALLPDPEHLASWDFSVLSRRFDSFMAPNYTTGRIESGIGRITAVAPPFDEAGIHRINCEMLRRAADRGALRQMWENQVGDTKFEVLAETEIPTDRRVPVFTFQNVSLTLFLFAFESALFREFLRLFLSSGSWKAAILYLVVGGAVFFACWKGLRRLWLHLTPARSIQTLGSAVFQAMRECGLLAGSARVETVREKNLKSISLRLRNASVRDQNLFNTAMAELLSPIENPRYIIIRKNFLGKLQFSRSYACPAVLGKKKEYAEALTKHLQACDGHYILLFTHREDGRRLILKCRRKSYITYNHSLQHKRYRVSRWQ